MANTIKAIETVYNGYRFRSRLEARWAVFFDTLGVKYEYEKEGYDLGEAGYYLPDFWLPDLGKWVEIKPDEPSAEENDKAWALAVGSNCDVVIMCGQIPVSEDDMFTRRFEFGQKYFAGDGSWDAPHIFTECAHGCGWIGIEFPNSDRARCKCSPDGDSVTWSPRLERAYTAARQARFEHREK